MTSSIAFQPLPTPLCSPPTRHIRMNSGRFAAWSMIEQLTVGAPAALARPDRCHHQETNRGENDGTAWQVVHETRRRRNGEMKGCPYLGSAAGQHLVRVIQAVFAVSQVVLPQQVVGARGHSRCRRRRRRLGGKVRPDWPKRDGIAKDGRLRPPLMNGKREGRHRTTTQTYRECQSKCCGSNECKEELGSFPGWSPPPAQPESPARIPQCWPLIERA